MKKYLLGFFAVAIALSLVSFTTPSRGVSTSQDLHWFLVDQNGAIGSYIGDGAMSKEEAEELSCEDTPGEDCARGYASATNPGTLGNPEVDDIERSSR